MRRVLVTGFEPFGGEEINASLEAARRLKYENWEDIEVEVRRLPTEFERVMPVLEEAVEQTNPDVVICVGQARGRAGITPERVAINVADARIQDNAGGEPADEIIVDGGPVGYWSTLPVKEIVEELHRAGIPAAVSNAAGTFVCNRAFYGLMHLLAIKYPETRGGFIHVPVLPEQALDAEAPSMALDQIVEALKLAIEVAARGYT